MLDLLHLAANPQGDPAEDRRQGDEQEDEDAFEDPGDREERRIRGAGDRRVVLVDDDDAGAATDGHGCVRAQGFPLLLASRRAS